MGTADPRQELETLSGRIFFALSVPPGDDAARAQVVANIREFYRLSALPGAPAVTALREEQNFATFGATFGHDYIVPVLAECDPSQLNNKDQTGATPGTHAALCDQGGYITALARAGANLNQADGFGLTPEQAAEGNQNALAALREAGVIDGNTIDEPAAIEEIPPHASGPHLSL